MLDGLKPVLRHLVLLVIAAVLTWAGTELVPALKDQPGWGALAATAVTMLLAILTPLTKQYGVGSGS